VYLLALLGSGKFHAKTLSFAAATYLAFAARLIPALA
jgi:hypothetical protein